MPDAMTPARWAAHLASGGFVHLAKVGPTGPHCHVNPYVARRGRVCPNPYCSGWPWPWAVA
jgi:hypothetical protein